MNINLSTLANGAVAERANIDLQRIFENIADPNTDWKKVRSLAITIKLQPDENRDIALASIDTKVALAPTKGVATKFVIDRDGRGSVVGAELVSGNKNQMMVDNDGDLADDRGRKVADEGGKVVNFK